MEKSATQDLYSRLISLNKEAFEAGLFDVAYHILAAALHCAKNIESGTPLEDIAKIASQQLGAIDQFHPEYVHSSKSTLNRSHGKSIFSLIYIQAESNMKMRKAREAGPKARLVRRE